MTPPRGASVDLLDRTRRDLGLSIVEVWWRYFAIGGMCTALELEGVFYRALIPSTLDRDLIAVVLNERCSELGGDHPIRYSDDEA